MMRSYSLIPLASGIYAYQLLQTRFVNGVLKSQLEQLINNLKYECMFETKDIAAPAFEFELFSARSPQEMHYILRIRVAHPSDGKRILKHLEAQFKCNEEGMIVELVKP